VFLLLLLLLLETFRVKNALDLVVQRPLASIVHPHNVDSIASIIDRIDASSIVKSIGRSVVARSGKGMKRAETSGNGRTNIKQPASTLSAVLLRASKHRAAAAAAAKRECVPSASFTLFEYSLATAARLISRLYPALQQRRGRAMPDRQRQPRCFNCFELPIKHGRIINNV